MFPKNVHEISEKCWFPFFSGSSSHFGGINLEDTRNFIAYATLMSTRVCKSRQISFKFVFITKIFQASGLKTNFFAKAKRLVHYKENFSQSPRAPIVGRLETQLGYSNEKLYRSKHYHERVSVFNVFAVCALISIAKYVDIVRCKTERRNSYVWSRANRASLRPSNRCHLIRTYSHGTPPTLYIRKLNLPSPRSRLLIRVSTFM